MLKYVLLVLFVIFSIASFIIHSDVLLVIGLVFAFILLQTIDVNEKLSK